MITHQNRALKVARYIISLESQEIREIVAHGERVISATLRNPAFFVGFNGHLEIQVFEKEPCPKVRDLLHTLWCAAGYSNYWKTGTGIMVFRT